MVLFIYLHIFFQLKTSNDLEIYEIEQPSKDTMEEICDLRQPVVFDFNNERLTETCNLNAITDNYGAFDVKVRNLQNDDDQSELYIPITLKATNQLLSNDNENKYVTENNQDFLEETGLIKCYRYNDAFLRPYMVSDCEYDLMTASDQTTTPFKYDINYRNFYLVTQGSVKVKLAPPKSKKYLYTMNDYENFEFRSPVNPWSPDTKYSADFDKIKCLEFTLQQGKTLYIPPYWWYSIKFHNNSSISCFNYRTYMNNIAVLPYVCLHALQIQNVKRDVVKKVNINELNNNTIIYSSDQKNFNDINEIAYSKNQQVENETYHSPSLPEPINVNNDIGTEISEQKIG